MWWCRDRRGKSSLSTLKGKNCCSWFSILSLFSLSQKSSSTEPAASVLFSSDISITPNHLQQLESKPSFCAQGVRDKPKIKWTEPVCWVSFETACSSTSNTIICILAYCELCNGDNCMIYNNILFYLSPALQ